MPRSQAEVRLAHAVASGYAKNSGMSSEYAHEVIDKMHGRKMSSLPTKIRPKKTKIRKRR